jgi:hypothetical protein
MHRRRARPSWRRWTKARFAPYCGETGLRARTTHTISDIDTLLDNVALTRRRGFAVDDAEDAEGVFCVSAAFFGHDGAWAGAISATGIKGDLPAWRIDQIGRTVSEYADRATLLIGGMPRAAGNLGSAARDLTLEDESLRTAPPHVAAHCQPHKVSEGPMACEPVVSLTQDSGVAIRCRDKVVPWTSRA